jgi:serine/threonine-protein kinase
MDETFLATRAGERTASSAPPATLGFAPGTILADRYRIIALLGRGGMGEVYRADDLRLGQPIAIKFLPEVLARSADARNRLTAEARNARSITHPNVCRVYDIGEIAGRVFLTMEYVDGEDLASLLRRIGRLPAQKASEIARQLCAGLEAAHEQGLLHRDLKPANVMIDGRGYARIMDFGLAMEARQAAEETEFAGTVPYMAPERFRGGPATVQSDLYALGLILYEAFTGRSPFQASTVEEWDTVHESSVPARPSMLSSEIDPATERIILQCLSKDPAARPLSARQIAAALPGGDPLAAAIAAGETPSPELVAASGAEGTLPRGMAWGLLAACLASLAAAAFIWQWTSLAGVVKFEGSPDVLRAKAKTILREIGQESGARDYSWDVVEDGPHLHHLAVARREAFPFASVGRAAPAPLIFRYRQSPAEMRPLGITGAVMFDDPPPVVPGEALITIDSRGRLTSLRVRPLPVQGGGDTSAEPEWSPVLAAMDLGGVALQPAAPNRVPPFAAEVRRAWTATVDGEQVVVEAAAYHGRIVYAERFGPWQQTAGGYLGGIAGLATRPAQTLLALLWMATLVAVALLARRNLNMGRGDRRGAMRVAAFMLAAGVVFSITGRHWVVDAQWLWMVVSTQLGAALFNAALAWLFYLGLEPSARRHWPQLLVSWTRLLEGRWRDPLVGQGLLAGVILGTLLPVAGTLPELSGRIFGAEGAQPSFWIASLAPAMRYLSAIGGMALMGLKNSLGILGFMVVARFAVRRDWAVLAATAFVAALSATSGVDPRPLDMAQALISGIVVVFFLRRFGLLALAAGLAVNYVVRQTPWTLDAAQWFAWRPAFTCALVLGLAVWGFINVLGRQSAFAALDIDR